MTLDEAYEVLDNVCPCLDRLCPDSDPIVQGELAEARAVIAAEDAAVEAQIEAHLEALAFGDEEVTEPW
jgi:hypothetical protein